MSGERSGAVSEDQEQQPDDVIPALITDLADVPQLRRYRVLGLMARGGMSQVYRARDTVIPRDVAIKVLPPELTTDPVRVERFRLEARRVAALQHPNIVPLLDSSKAGSPFFLVMPFYPGALREELQMRGALPLPEVVNIVAQVASALDYAHAHGIIHRDVKPENILLDADGRALLTDFGISKSEQRKAPENLATSAPLTAAEAGQMPIASIEYSSPEHLLGRPTDARSDEYALAVVAYEMLTRYVPFALDPERMYTMLVRMLTERPIPPSRLAPEPLPPEVDVVLLKALSSDPNLRYPAPGAFAEDLKRIVRNSQELASLAPVPTPEPDPVPAFSGPLVAADILPPDPEDLPRPTVADWRELVPGAGQDIENVWTQPLEAANKRRRARLRFLRRR
jgi:serine/threonine-protein kinase